MIKTYVTNPVKITAIEFDGSYKSAREINRWSGAKVEINPDIEGLLEIHTLEGTMQATKGDFIIKGLRGEFYPCKPDVFHKKYRELIEIPDASL